MHPSLRVIASLTVMSRGSGCAEPGVGSNHQDMRPQPCGPGWILGSELSLPLLFCPGHCVQPRDISEAPPCCAVSTQRFKFTHKTASLATPVCRMLMPVCRMPKLEGTRGTALTGGLCGVAGSGREGLGHQPGQMLAGRVPTFLSPTQLPTSFLGRVLTSPASSQTTPFCSPGQALCQGRGTPTHSAARRLNSPRGSFDSVTC